MNAYAAAEHRVRGGRVAAQVGEEDIGPLLNADQPLAVAAVRVEIVGVADTEEAVEAGRVAAWAPVTPVAGWDQVALVAGWAPVADLVQAWAEDDN